MEVQVNVLHSDNVGRNFIAANQAQVDQIYQHNLAFWRTRFTTEFTPEARQQVLDAQDEVPNPYTQRTIAKLQEIYGEISRNGEFSMVEIGAANGSGLRRIETKFPNPKLHFLGFECLPLLVEDFQQKHPEHTMHVGAIEDFIDMDEAPYADAKFSLFYSSGVFLMIKPELVRAGLRKAAKLSDRFLIYDLLAAPHVPAPPKDHAAVVQMANRKVFWFLHPWKEYIAEQGFVIVDSHIAQLSPDDLTRFDPQIQGYGFLYAERR